MALLELKDGVNRVHARAPRDDGGGAQLPVAEAVGSNTEQVSFLSDTDQVIQLILFFSAHSPA